MCFSREETGIGSGRDTGDKGFGSDVGRATARRIAEHLITRAVSSQKEGTSSQEESNLDNGERVSERKRDLLRADGAKKRVGGDTFHYLGMCVGGAQEDGDWRGSAPRHGCRGGR